MVFCLLACSSNDETVALSDLYPGSFNLEYPENEQACLDGSVLNDLQLSLIHISSPRDRTRSRMPSSA